MLLPLIKDNLHIKDKLSAPNLSFIERFHCIMKRVFGGILYMQVLCTLNPFIRSDATRTVHNHLSLS